MLHEPLPPVRDDAPALHALRQVRLLQDLPDEVLADVARACRFRRYRARQQVIERDDVDRDCYLVLAGRLRVTVWSPSGREVSFREVGAGEMFGEMAALDGRPRSASVVALGEALLARISPETLQALLQRHWPICERLLRHLAGATRGLTDRVYELSAYSVRQRLCAELLRLCAAQAAARGCGRAEDRADDRVDDRAELRPAPGQRDLAGRIGSVREQVTREMAELERAGLLERRDGALLIPSVQSLAAQVDAVR